MSKKDKIFDLVKAGILTVDDALILINNEANDDKTVKDEIVITTNMKASSNNSFQTKTSKSITKVNEKPLDNSFDNIIEPNLKIINNAHTNSAFSIFIGLDKLKKDDLRYQIASLEKMTMMNILATQGKKAINFSKKLFNQENVQNSAEISIEVEISKRANELEDWKISDLQRLLRTVLADKVKSAGATLALNYSDFDLTRAIINISSKHFKKKINSEISYAEKADHIHMLYFQQLQQQFAKSMESQTAEQLKQTDRVIQTELDKMTPQQSKELQKALQTEKLSGEIVRKAIISGGSGTTLMLAINGAGFGAYQAATTIIHAIFTTGMGVTLPFAAYTGAASFISFITGPAGWLILGGSQALMINRNKNKLIYQLMAQIVWLSVQANGDFYSETTSSDLPEFMSDMERDKKQKLEKDIYILNNQINDIELQSQNLEQKIKNLSSKLDKSQETIKEYLLDKSILDNQLKLEQLNTKNPQKINELQAEIKNLEKQIILVTNEKDETEQLYNMLHNEKSENDQFYEEKLFELQYKLHETEEEKEALQKNYSKIHKLNESKVKKAAEKLKEAWDKKYVEISFSDNVYKEVIKNFNDKDIINMERKLFEMILTPDPRTLSTNRGKMHNTKEEHVAFKADGEGRIFYRINPDNSNQSIHITKIVKHNDPRYGK